MSALSKKFKKPWFLAFHVIRNKMADLKILKTFIE